MQIKYVDFKGSYPTEGQCPKDGKPEYAFIGRSNVGKSSLINMLMGRKNLAHVSGKPGKTQLLNFYLIDDSWYIVDLPGYGYAKISKTKRKEWEKMIQTYLIKRQSLQCAFVLIDCNIPPQKLDIEFINWMGAARIPFLIIFTKKDKSKPEEVEANIAAFQQKLLEDWENLPQQFVTSANTGEGRKEILEFISTINHQSQSQ